MKINKRSSDNHDSMKILYLFIGSAFMLSGGYFLYEYWSPLIEVIFTLIGVAFVASGFWIVYYLAYKPRDRMEISTKIAIIVMVIAGFVTITCYIFLSPPQEYLPPQETTFHMSVLEVDYEPERYFVLDEEMGTYPLFRLAFDKIEVERTGFGSIEITREEMELICNKIEKVFKYENESIFYRVYFKYESNFYRVFVDWFTGCPIIPIIY